jgi:hypothetical protein
MYKVIGQFSPNIELTIETEPYRFDKEFELHTDALNYYSTTLADMGENISDIGGEFVITLIGASTGEERILKRHVLSTTILVI